MKPEKFRHVDPKLIQILGVLPYGGEVRGGRMIKRVDLCELGFLRQPGACTVLVDSRISGSGLS